MYISVRVVAGQKIEKVEELGGRTGRLKVWVRQPAKQGLANARVRELVAAHYRVPLRQVRLVGGAHQPAKLFSIQDK